MDLETAILTSASLGDAASAAGLPLAEFLDRLADAALRKNLDAKTHTVYHESMRQLYLSAARAVTILQRASAGEDIPKAQVSAAKALLVHSEKAREYFSLELKLRELEEAIHA